MWQTPLIISSNYQSMIKLSYENDGKTVISVTFCMLESIACTLSNTEDTDEVFHQGLHCLLRLKQ